MYAKRLMLTENIELLYNVEKTKRSSTMKNVINHEKYGEIVYNESVWTGKKRLFVNGAELARRSKNTYVYDVDGVTHTAVITGNFLMGATLLIGGEKIQIVPKIKWYEIALGVIMFAFFLVWGNVPTLCAMFPLVGGAIGGFVSALFGIGAIVTMKFLKPIWAKLVTWVVCFGAAIGINYGLALAVISLMQ